MLLCYVELIEVLHNLLEKNDVLLELLEEVLAAAAVEVERRPRVAIVEHEDNGGNTVARVDASHRAQLVQVEAHARVLVVPWFVRIAAAAAVVMMAVAADADRLVLARVLCVREHRVVDHKRPVLGRRGRRVCLALSQEANKLAVFLFCCCNFRLATRTSASRRNGVYYVFDDLKSTADLVGLHQFAVDLLLLHLVDVHLDLLVQDLFIYKCKHKYQRDDGWATRMQRLDGERTWSFIVVLRWFEERRRIGDAMMSRPLPYRALFSLLLRYYYYFLHFCVVVLCWWRSIFSRFVSFLWLRSHQTWH